MKTSLNKLAFAYILNAIDGDGYQVELSTPASKVAFAYECFKSEYWHAENQRYYRNNEIEGFKNWLMGLPSSIHVAFSHFDIINIAKDWGSIPANSTERQEDKIIDNWFNFISVKFFQLKKQIDVNPAKVSALLSELI